MPPKAAISRVYIYIYVYNVWSSSKFSLCIVNLWKISHQLNKIKKKTDEKNIYIQGHTKKRFHFYNPVTFLIFMLGK